MPTTISTPSALRLALTPLPQGETAICFHGRLDSTTAEVVRDVLRNLENQHQGDVVVVATDIESIDREGIGVLLASLRRLRLQGRDLHVTWPAPTVSRALRYLNLHRVLITGGRLPLHWNDPCLEGAYADVG